MIWDSSYWKDDLLRRAKVLSRRKSQKRWAVLLRRKSPDRWQEASLARIEQDLMLGFYGIRKLIEASKLSDAVAKQLVALNLHPRTGKTVTKLNWHKLDELFDYNHSSREERYLDYVCNQFIHSYIFCVVTDDGGALHGFYFASDRQRRRGLYFLNVDEVIRIFRQVGEDYPNEVRMQWDQDFGDYRVESKTHRGPVGPLPEGSE